MAPKSPVFAAASNASIIACRSPMVVPSCVDRQAWSSVVPTARWLSTECGSDAHTRPPARPWLLDVGQRRAQVKLINLEGMSLIGPGSEWFWTALSGIVLAVTFLAIYRQLRLARSAGVREISAAFDREWDSERMLRHRLAILVARRDGVREVDIAPGSASALVNYWEGIAQLARSGNMDLPSLYATYGYVCQAWWALLEQRIHWWRTEQRDPSDAENFEWLARAMRNMDRRAGRPAFDPSAVAIGITARIASLEDRLRVEEALRTLVIASPAAPPASRVARPAARTKAAASAIS